MKLIVIKSNGNPSEDVFSAVANSTHFLLSRHLQNYKIVLKMSLLDLKMSLKGPKLTS